MGLLPRIAARADLSAVASELGAAAADRLRRERALAAARELGSAETLRAVTQATARLGFAPVLLKGRALAVAGYSKPLSRPSSDLDLLVPREQLSPLRRELLAAGFEQSAERGYEHQLPALRHPQGEPIELHRHLPGVRLEGRSSAGWGELVGAGLVEALPRSPADGEATVLVPAREVLTAHALVHALAQHGLSTAYPGWLLIGDLLDLAVETGPENLGRASWFSWIRHDLSDAEVGAALELAACVGRGESPLLGALSERADLLCRHLLAAALDERYGRALKARWLEAPVTDRTPLAARLRLLGRAFVPPVRRSPSGQKENGLRRAVRWLGRPFELGWRALRAQIAARRQ